MNCLFNSPIKYKKVRKEVTARQYKNGEININGIKYLFYSMTEAIKKFRKQYPIK
jgi:hypothetical protein